MQNEIMKNYQCQCHLNPSYVATTSGKIGINIVENVTVHSSLSAAALSLVTLISTYLSLIWHTLLAPTSRRMWPNSQAQSIVSLSCILCPGHCSEIILQSFIRHVIQIQIMGVGVHCQIYSTNYWTYTLT